MAAHARLKNEFTEDEKCHNLVMARWYLFCGRQTFFLVFQYAIKEKYMYEK